MNDTFTTMNSEEASIPRTELPRPRIHHFMLWSVVAAALLSLVRLAASMGRIDDLGHPAMGGVMTIYAVVTSGAIAVTLLGCYWRHLGLAYFQEPGQWLGLEITTRVAVIIGLALMGTADSFGLFILSCLLGGLFWAGLNISIAQRFGWRGAWSYLFLAKVALVVALLVANNFGGYLLYAVLFYGGYLVVIGLQVAGVIADRRRGICRHWTHWHGLAAHLTINVVTVATMGL
jgi:hypothetical protein